MASLISLIGGRFASTGRWAFAPLCRSTCSPKVRHFATKASPASPAKLSEDFNTGTSSVYAEEMYDKWKTDPASVHKSWDTYFNLVTQGKPPGAAFTSPYNLKPQQPVGTAPTTSVDVAPGVVEEALKLFLLKRAYQVVGHRIANLDPLGLNHKEIPPELTLEFYGWTEKDLDRVVTVPETGSGRLMGGKRTATLGEFISRLKETYCGTVGFEFMHIPYRNQCDWLRDQLETSKKWIYPTDVKLKILERLAFAEGFEKFLAQKHPGTKRFGLDGGESLIPGLKALIDRAAELGVTDVVIGMAHRGRLNVLANVLRKPLESIFCEFTGVPASPQEGGFSGDVKYHLGTSYDRPTLRAGTVHISVVANPSHLEAVNPVVEGKVRAKQYFQKDFTRKKILPLLIHGDAAMAGQGVVSETLMLSELNKYTTGGTVHVVINNQIGFTTDVCDSRSSPYPTDVVKAISVPIFHVNGDDPEAVTYVFEKAIEYRQTYGKDCVVDIFCYRKFGHNEGDPPEFTQPVMYKTIRSMKSCLEKYSQQLLTEGAVSKERLKKMNEHVIQVFNDGFERSKTHKYQQNQWLSSFWAGFKGPDQQSRIRTTGVAMETLQRVGAALCKIPENFNAHKILVRLFAAKADMFKTGQNVDWATAEAMAFGTLLLEGIHVRLSGQDVQRGTFSHRHAVLNDQQTGERYTPLNNIAPGEQETFEVCNSNLSEFGVMGFELGYSLVSPNSLVLWEAQFGDFTNGAQVIIDQFLSCGEHKWYRQCGLVLLLPHGYDGQGPEHSSARLERFLTLSNSDPNNRAPEGREVQYSNWQVVNITTPANYFHCLRRQIHRQFRKPLIVMSPKSLLRHRECVSRLDEFDDVGDDTKFFSVIGDQGNLVADNKVKRVVFCTGKIYYELAEHRAAQNINDVAIVRVEQLVPFPFKRIEAQLQKYTKAQVMWCQEEPQNMGAYWFITHHMNNFLKARGQDIMYAGRTTSASPSTGSAAQHKIEQDSLINAAFAF